MLTTGTTSGLTVSLLSLCTILLLRMTHSQDIVIPPISMVGFVGSEVVFTCGTRNAPSVTWKVNGTFFSSLSPSMYGDWHIDQDTTGEIDMYTITIPARSEYNGTLVQCIAIAPRGSSTESENAIFLVQGLLAPVHDLRAENGQESIFLSWNPPFSLDVTGVDPDIWYTVLISNVTDEDNPTNVSCVECHSLTQPHYTYTYSDPSPCHEYSFTIIPENKVGEGNRSEPVIGYFIAVPPSVNITQMDIYSNQKSWGKYEFIVLLPIFLGVCAGKLPEHYLVYFETDYNVVKCPGFVSDLLQTESCQCTLSFDKDVEDIYNCVYSITLEMINRAGRTNSSGSITLCKGLHVYYFNDSLCDFKSHGVEKDWSDLSKITSLTKPQQTPVAYDSHSTDEHPECFNTTRDFTFQEGLGFGAAIGFISALVITTTTVLAALFVRSRSTKGKKKELVLKRNRAYEVHAFNSAQLFPDTLQSQPSVTTQGTHQTEVVHMSSGKNPVYEEVK